MDLGDLGVGESGRFAPTFTHPIHNPELCHFDWKNAAKRSFEGRNLIPLSLPHYAQKTWVKSRNDKVKALQGWTKAGRL